MTASNHDPEVDALDSWGPRTDVLIIPGRALFVGKEHTAIASALRGSGFRVRLQKQGPRVAFSSDLEHFLAPIVIFSSAALASGAGDLMADAVRALVQKYRREWRPAKSPPVRLSLRVGRRFANGAVDWFEAAGPADSVLSGFRAWERGTRRAETDRAAGARLRSKRVHTPLPRVDKRLPPASERKSPKPLARGSRSRRKPR
jgi:hypothetical protein